MRALGFEPFLDDAVQAPIIYTFRMPPGFDFPHFYAGMRRRGYVIYPGKLTRSETFRIGCIGALGPDDIRGALDAVRATSQEDMPR